MDIQELVSLNRQEWNPGDVLGVAGHVAGSSALTTYMAQSSGLLAQLARLPRAMLADEDLHRHAVENLDQADALLFGRVTYEMMEAAWRSPAQTGARPDWMESFARTIDAAKKYVVSSTLDRVDWNAELLRGDLGKAVQQLKRESGKGLLVEA
jgi:dihydrofolate reductase